ncbi:MAG: NifB/NifX family molybdenum-iron cluster-binding protein [Proteobacteria bacterium]|nr:NifB/NifX family molybdenum-iron cluster-binding protein [Pseudomonadota bacterium]
MRIAFPVQENQGLDSPVYGHFGSAAHFVILDSVSGSFQTVPNADAQHVHGQCQPMKGLGSKAVDAVVVGGIGAGALMRLQAHGIKVFRALEGTVKENLEFVKAGKLPEYVTEMTCAGHHQKGGCAH